MKRACCIVFILGFISCENFNGSESALKFKEVGGVRGSESQMEQETEIEPIPEETTVEQISFETLKSRVLDSYSCTQCHRWANDKNSFNAKIESNIPEDNLLYKLVKQGDMPLRERAVTNEDLEILENYILKFSN